MEYPPDFPERLQSKVDEVIAAAEVSFIDAKAKRSNAVYEDSLSSYIETVFFGFAQQCVEAGREGYWTGERIRRAFREFLDVVIDRTFRDKLPSNKQNSTTRYQFREAALSSSQSWVGWREIHEGLNHVFKSPVGTNDASSRQGLPVGVIDEKARRELLLAEYKTATGNPSNKRLYEAGNSGIHKPQFYTWLSGHLSCESATRINFERFLKEKKPPIRRK